MTASTRFLGLAIAATVALSLAAPPAAVAVDGQVLLTASGPKTCKRGWVWDEQLKRCVRAQPRGSF